MALLGQSQIAKCFVQYIAGGATFHYSATPPHVRRSEQRYIYSDVALVVEPGPRLIDIEGKLVDELFSEKSTTYLVTAA
jgi:hypothetical protein